MRFRTLVVACTVILGYGSSMIGILNNIEAIEQVEIADTQKSIIKISSETTPQESNVVIETVNTEELPSVTETTSVQIKTTKNKKTKKKVTTNTQKETTRIIVQTTKEAKPKTTKPKTTKPNTTKPKTTKPKPTQPPTKALGYYSESNILSSGKVNLIKNSVRSHVSGSNNEELNSLARYMSARGGGNAASIYKSLTGATRSLKSRTCSVSLESDSQTNVLQVASNAASKIGGISSSRYGIGVSTKKLSSGYQAYIVVVYE